MLHFFPYWTIFHYHRDAFFRILIFLRVVLFSCRTLFRVADFTFFVLHYLCGDSCCTLLMSSCVDVFFWCVFSCCFLFMLQFFRVALFSCWTTFMFHFFHIALFLCWTFFVVHSFHVAPFFVLHSFHVAPFCVFHPFILHPFFLHSSSVTPFSCCALFVLQFFPFSFISCCTRCMSHFFQLWL